MCSEILGGWVCETFHGNDTFIVLRIDLYFRQGSQSTDFSESMAVNTILLGKKLPRIRKMV